MNGDKADIRGGRRDGPRKKGLIYRYEEIPKGKDHDSYVYTVADSNSDRHNSYSGCWSFSKPTQIGI